MLSISTKGTTRRPVIIVGPIALKIVRNADGRACNRYEANVCRNYTAAPCAALPGTVVLCGKRAHAAPRGLTRPPSATENAPEASRISFGSRQNGGGPMFTEPQKSAVIDGLLAAQTALRDVYSRTGLQPYVVALAGVKKALLAMGVIVSADAAEGEGRH